MLDDALTADEIAAFRRVQLSVDRERKRWRIGLAIMWRGRDCWRVGLSVGPWTPGITFQTFDAYRRWKLALGPYRNG